MKTFDDSGEDAYQRIKVASDPYASMLSEAANHPATVAAVKTFLAAHHDNVLLFGCICFIAGLQIGLEMNSLES